MFKKAYQRDNTRYSLKKDRRDFFKDPQKLFEYFKM